MSDIRNFVLRDEEGNEHGVFIGKQPRQAALKAANRGRDKIQTGDYPTQGTWDKESARFQGMETRCRSPRNRPALDARENQQALCQEKENRK